MEIWGLAICITQCFGSMLICKKFKSSEYKTLVVILLLVLYVVFTYIIIKFFLTDKYEILYNVFLMATPLGILSVFEEKK